MNQLNIESMEGVILTPLRIIPGEKGSVLHGLRADDPSFQGFGEAYFSTILNGQFKGWKRHRQMVLNLIVPSGEIRFVIFDDRADSNSRGSWAAICLSRNDYSRLTIPPEVWLAFQGIAPGESLLLNIANIPHDPLESETRSLDATGFPELLELFPQHD